MRKEEILDREEPKKEIRDRLLWIVGLIVFSLGFVFESMHSPLGDIFGLAGGVLLSATATSSYIVVKKKNTLRSLSVLVPVLALLVLKYHFRFYNIWLIATAVSSFVVHFVLLARFRGRL